MINPLPITTMCAVIGAWWISLAVITISCCTLIHNWFVGIDLIDGAILSNLFIVFGVVIFATISTIEIMEHFSYG